MSSVTQPTLHSSQDTLEYKAAPMTEMDDLKAKIKKCYEDNCFLRMQIFGLAREIRCDVPKLPDSFVDETVFSPKTGEIEDPDWLIAECEERLIQIRLKNIFNQLHTKKWELIEELLPGFGGKNCWVVLPSYLQRRHW